MKIKSISAASAALALGLVGALAIAAPASADDVTTPDWEWSDVSDDGLYIDDAGSYYSNFMGTGIAMRGWSDDAFDGYISSVTLQWDGDDYDIEFAPESANFVPNGLSTVVGTGTVSVNEFDIEVTSTLEIQGGTARWTFSFDGDPETIAASSLYVEGNLGSDSDSVYSLVGAHGVVSHDEGYDPILGWDASGSGVIINAVDGDDYLGFTFDAVSGARLTVGLVEYDVCSQAAAFAQMTAAVPTLASQFGATFAPVYSKSCATVVSPVIAPGAVNVNLPITSSEILDDWGYFNAEDSNRLNVVATGLPSGMAISVSYEGSVPTLHLTGSAPEGVHNVTAWVYFSDDELSGSYPLQITFAFGAAPALAATGAPSTAPAIVSGGVLALIGAALMLVSTLQRARTSN